MARKARARIKATNSNLDKNGSDTQATGSSARILEDLEQEREVLAPLIVNTQNVGDGGFGDILFPAASLLALQHQSSARRDFSEWL